MDSLQALVLVLAVVVVGLVLQVRTLAGRVGKLERDGGWEGAQPNQLAPATMAAGATALTPGQPSEVSDAVLGFIQAGKKIDAIKQYRLETGVGLKEAKDAVEGFERGGR
jgi:large subunit ribosomal protein L7/L12